MIRAIRSSENPRIDNTIIPANTRSVSKVLWASMTRKPMPESLASISTPTSAIMEIAVDIRIPVMIMGSADGIRTLTHNCFSSAPSERAAWINLLSTPLMPEIVFKTMGKKACFENNHDLRCVSDTEPEKKYRYQRKS